MHYFNDNIVQLADAYEYNITSNFTCASCDTTYNFVETLLIHLNVTTPCCLANGSACISSEMKSLRLQPAKELTQQKVATRDSLYSDNHGGSGYSRRSNGGSGYSSTHTFSLIGSRPSIVPTLTCWVLSTSAPTLQNCFPRQCDHSHR